MFVFFQETDENTDTIARLGIEARGHFLPSANKRDSNNDRVLDILYAGDLHFQFISIQSVHTSNKKGQTKLQNIQIKTK